MATDSERDELRARLVRDQQTSSRVTRAYEQRKRGYFARCAEDPAYARELERARDELRARLVRDRAYEQRKRSHAEPSEDWIAANSDPLGFFENEA